MGSFLFEIIQFARKVASKVICGQLFLLKLAECFCFLSVWDGQTESYKTDRYVPDLI